MRQLTNVPVRKEAALHSQEMKGGGQYRDGQETQDPGPATPSRRGLGAACVNATRGPAHVHVRGDPTYPGKRAQRTGNTHTGQ